MDQLEYTAGNRLIRYPFVDGALFTWDDDHGNSGTIPNDIFLDAQYTVYSGDVSVPAFYYIRKQATTGGVNWFLHFAEDSHGDIDGWTFVADGTTGNVILIAKAVDESTLLKLEVDIDKLNELANGYDDNNYVFDIGVKLSLSCLRILPPNVTRIDLYNTTHTTPETVLETTDTLTISEGTNVSLVQEGNETILSVLRGAGAGLYDGCPKPGSQILSVNGATATTDGNLLINNDYCYSTYAGEAGLHLKNSCRPRCTSDDVVNLADYYNRVSDLANQLSDYLLSAQGDYNELLDQYYTLEEAKLVPKNPYVLALNNTLSNATAKFHNIAIGVYSPSKTVVGATVAISYDTASLTYQPRSGYINQDSISTKFNDPIFSSGHAILFSQNLKCNSVLYSGFTVRQPLAGSTKDVTITLSSAGNGSSGYILPLNPVTFDYSVEYSVQPTTDKKIVTLSVNLVDITKPIASTSLNPFVSGAYELVSSKLNIDNVSTDLSDKGFQNRTLDFSKTNVYKLELAYPLSNSGVETVQFFGISLSGSVTKTAQINLAI